MKITNEKFFLARRDKQLNMLGIFKRSEESALKIMEERTYLRLIISQREKYTHNERSIFVETNTELSIKNSSRWSLEYQRDVKEVRFVLEVFREQCHIRTFLNAIRRDSELSFRLEAFRRSAFLQAHEGVSHSLYGVIDGKHYLLQAYAGPDNGGSPVG